MRDSIKKLLHSESNDDVRLGLEIATVEELMEILGDRETQNIASERGIMYVFIKNKPYFFNLKLKRLFASAYSKEEIIRTIKDDITYK